MVANAKANEADKMIERLSRALTEVRGYMYCELGEASVQERLAKITRKRRKNKYVDDPDFSKLFEKNPALCLPDHRLSNNVFDLNFFAKHLYYKEAKYVDTLRVGNKLLRVDRTLKDIIMNDVRRGKTFELFVEEMIQVAFIDRSTFIVAWDDANRQKGHHF